MAKEKGTKLTFKEVMDNLNKDYGKGSVVEMSEKLEDGYDVVSTGSIAFDRSLGIGGWQPGKLYELMGWEGTGKAQPLSSKILTPTGWKTMGEMRLGTIVSTPDGGDSTVIGIFPQGEQDVYKITFDDKTFTYCTLDHLWSVNTRKNPEVGEVLSVKELLERKLKKSNDTRKFNIPTTKPLNFQQFGKITINPYLLGLLLGDGGLTDNSVKITTADEDILKEISYILETEYADMKLSEKMGKYTYNLRKKGNGKKSNKIYEEIKELGLLGKYSHEKHIPKEYLFTSIENRVALLQGLMDSDGSVENKTLSYSTTSLQLNKDFEELCRGLGFRCNTSSRITKYTSPSGTKLDGRISYRSTLLMNTFLFIPFRLTRKKDLFKEVRSGFSDRYIESIENTGRKEQCQCIAIGHPDHLYITDNYIVTHNTTICGHAVKGFQEKFPDKKVVYIDAEHALDKTYFKALGVDVDSMILSQPDYGEMGFNTAEKLIETGEVSLLIIDSNTAMIPKKVIDGEAGDNALGLQARLNSQMYPKIKAKLIKGNTCVIVISQFREKIGVMFGCFHYKSKLVLADGTSEWIGKIVNNKMDVEVLSVVDGKIVPRKVIDWHKNGEAEKFWSMEVAYPHGKGRSNLRIADDHIIFTPTGEKRFTELKVGDDVMVKSYKYLNKEQMQIIIGSMLGDGSIRLTSTKSTGSMRFKHAIGQNDYCEYKSKVLGDYFKGSSGFDNKGRFWWDSKPTSEITYLSKYKSRKSLRFVDQELLEQIDLRAIAIWYLDDGTFGGSTKNYGWGKSVIYAKNLAYESKLRLEEKFLELGLPTPSCTKAGLMFSGENNKLFQEKIAEFVPECMKYKIHPKLQDKVGTNIYFEQGKEELTLIPTKITKIKELKKDKATQKFDISVEEGECYFVDNTLVHNSPVTTNGGHALKFYTDVRIEVSKSEDKENLGNLTKIKVKKNKMAPPFVEGSFFIKWGVGIDTFQEVIDLAVDANIIQKSGSWYSYNGDKIGQGEAAVSQLLADNPELFNEIKEKVNGI